MEARRSGVAALCTIPFIMKAPLAVFVVLLVSRLVFAADPKLQQEGTQLIQTAIDKTNIFALPSFVLKAVVTVNSSGKEINGAYELFWNGPDQWREQILFPDYGEIRVGQKGVVHVKRSETFFTLEIETLRSTLGFGAVPVSRSVSSLWVLPEHEEIISKIERRKIRGISAQCIELKRKRDQGTFKRNVCISDVNGAISCGATRPQTLTLSLSDLKSFLVHSGLIHSGAVLETRVHESRSPN